MTQNAAPYAPPSIEVVGTLQELTRAGNLFPSDDGINLNTAQPIPTS